MRYLSVCSGIEAATVAWHDLGFNPIGFSEIEKFPCEVLANHYPTVTNYGDMTKFKEWNINEKIDLIVGGTPCQSFSIAGLRAGLNDPRGNLMLTYLAMVEHFQPKWVVWENVPGVLSSNGGEDFAGLLKGLAQLGYGFAYRVLDAQYFGVPQRRRRVFVVGCLGDWRSAAEVLFEPESLRRNITPSRSEGEKVTTRLTQCFNRRSNSEYDVKNIASTMNARDYKGATDLITVYENHGTDSRVKNVDVCPTMTSRCSTGGNNVTFALVENIIGRQPLNGGNGDGFTEGGPMYTLNATGVHGVVHVKSDSHINQHIAFKVRGGCAGGGKGFLGNDNIAFTLSTNQDQHLFTQTVAPTLTTNDPSRIPRTSEVTKQIEAVYNITQAVRRLTPVECERLQGFPDNYTNIKDKCPDGPRYKALGNSMAVPVMKWLGQRIINVNNNNYIQKGIS